MTLAFARELRDRLQASGRFRVVMTRDSDEFLRLDDRVRIARQNEADLLISIHADTISVKASGARRSIRSPTRPPMPIHRRWPIARIFPTRWRAWKWPIPTTRWPTFWSTSSAVRHTVSRSALPARWWTNSAIRRADQESASLRRFKVLKAPDVPSVLIELGYLSNPADEAQLIDPKWRIKAAESISNAVSQFAAAKAAGG